MSSEASDSAVRPGDPEQLGRLIKCVHHGHHRALDVALARLGISLVQWSALREIDRHPGCSQHQLAEHTFNSDQALGTLASRLIARGLIERTPGEGRARSHHLTADGKALLRAGQKVMSEIVGQSFGPLTKTERSELARLLTKILDARVARCAAPGET